MYSHLRAVVVCQSGEERSVCSSPGACHFQRVTENIREHVPVICFMLVSSYNASIIGWLVGSWLASIVLEGLSENAWRESGSGPS
jgi:hypothetical protein